MRHANLVSFICQKACAFDQRFERKDAHDLVNCIEHTSSGMERVAAAFSLARGSKHTGRRNVAVDPAAPVRTN